MATQTKYDVIIGGNASGALKALQETNKAFERLKASTDSSTKSQRLFNAEIAKASRQQELEKIAKSASKIAVETKDAEKAARQLLIQLEAIGATEAEISSAARAFNRYSSGGGRDLFKDDFGDTSSGFSAAAGAISGLTGGSGAVSEIATLVADISGFVEFIPTLGTAIAGIGLAAAPVIAIGAAVAIGFTAVSSALEESRKQAEQAAEFIARRNSLQAELDQLLQEGDVQSLKDRQDAVGRELETLNRTRSDYIAARDEIQAAYDATGDLFQKLTLRQQIDEYNSQIEDLDTDRLKELNQEFFEITNVTFSEDFKSAADTLKEVGASNFNDLKVQEEQLRAQRDQHQATLQALTDQEIKATEAAQERTEALKAQRELQDSRAEQDRVDAAKRADEDLKRSLEDQALDHQSSLVKIAGDGAKKIEDLQGSIAEKYVDAAKQTSKITSDLNKSLIEAERDYAKDALDDQRAFNRQRKDIERDFKRTIQDAERDTNVSAFIDAQRERKDALKDVRRDEKDADRERRDTLEDARRQASDAAQERIQQINEELAAFTEKSNKELALTKTLTENSIAEAEREYQVKLAKDADLRAIQTRRAEEDLAKQQQRLAEDRRIQDEAAAVQLARQLSDIEVKRLAETTALNDVLLKAQEISAAIGGTAPRVAAAPLSVPSPSSTPFPSLPLAMRDNGGAGMRGQRYRIGTGAQPEEFIAPANGYFVPNANRGDSITVNASGMFSGAVFGQVPTYADLDEMGNFIVQKIKNGIKRGRTG